MVTNFKITYTISVFLFSLFSSSINCYASCVYTFDDLFPQEIRHEISNQSIDNLLDPKTHQLVKTFSENGYVKKAYANGIIMLEADNIDIGLKCLLYAENHYVPESLLIFYKISKDMYHKISEELRNKIKDKFLSNNENFDKLYERYKINFAENAKSLTSKLSQPSNKISPFRNIKNSLQEILFHTSHIKVDSDIVLNLKKQN